MIGVKSAALGLFAFGLVGASLGTSDFLDARIQFCDTSTNPCTSRIFPAWAALPHNPKYVKFIPGSPGTKIFGSVLGLFSFIGSMMLCRALAEQEPMRQKFKAVADAEALREFSTQTDLDFKVYTHRASLRAAEVAYQVLQPYQEPQPLLEGDSLDDITSPSNKIAPEDEMLADKKHYLNIGSTALTCLGTLTQSTILISTPGAGKTTTICTAWGRMRERLGEIFQATAIIYKRDDAKAFEGIAQVLCFPDNPEKAVLTILGFVRNMKSGGNKGTTNRLFIDDFLTVWEEITARFRGKYIDDYGDITVKRTADNFPIIDWLVSQLNAVFLIGRQSDNALWICSHSPNVESLPFVKDKSSRIAANLIFLARQDPKNKNGNYEVIEANISNHHLIANDDKRSQLSEILPELISLSRQSGEPIILTSHGQSGGWEMGLVGSEIQQEYEQYRKQWASVSHPKDQPKDEVVIVQPQSANKPDFDELLSEIIKSFSGKEATRISRIEAGCNRVRTALADFDSEKKKKIWVYLIERLVAQGRAEVVGDNEAQIKARLGIPVLTLEHEFRIVID